MCFYVISRQSWRTRREETIDASHLDLYLNSVPENVGNHHPKKDEYVYRSTYAKMEPRDERSRALDRDVNAHSEDSTSRTNTSYNISRSLPRKRFTLESEQEY